MNGRPSQAGALPRSSMSCRGNPTGRNSRDPRPVGDRAYAAQCARNVVDFLSMRGFGRTIALDKFLREPMSKDFYDIFKFLLAQLDPQLEIDGKMEDEVPVIMRRLRYPVEVNRSKLQSICGPNTWPQLLAVLDWLISLIQVHDTFIAPVAECELGLADDMDCEADHDTLRTLHENYLQFLSGKDDHTVEERLRQVYEERLNAMQLEVDRLQEQKAGMEGQLYEFRSEHDRLLETQAAPKRLEIEADRLRGATQVQEARGKRLEEETVEIEAEERTALSEIEALQVQAQQLQEQIDQQAYSKQDVQRLKCERAHLRRMLEDLKSDFEKAEQGDWELGIEESRLEESISRTARVINDKIETVDSAMTLDDVSNEEDLELLVRVDLSEPTDVLGSIDFKAQTKNVAAAEQKHKEATRREAAAAYEVATSQNAVTEELCEKEKEVRRLKVRLEQLTRIREEYRVWSDEQLDDARQTAESAEDAAREAEIRTAGPTVRDAAEVDELRLLLSDLSSQLEGDRKLMDDKIRREQEARELHQKSVRKEMRMALEAMEHLREDVEHKVAELENEDHQEGQLRRNPARGGS